jgi:pilus assembly protein Flp/PilA
MLNFVTFLRAYIETLRTDDLDRGAALVEYALLVSLIAIVVIPALLILGPAILNIFNDIAGEL